MRFLAPIRKRRPALFLLVLWMSVIFLFSSFPGGTMKYEMPLWMYVERKGAHMFEFFVLTLLSWNVFRAFFPKEKSGFLIPTSAGLALLYALSDETHQLFVFGREGKVTDIWFDVSGMVVASLMIAYLSIRKKPTEKRNVRSRNGGKEKTGG